MLKKRGTIRWQIRRLIPFGRYPQRSGGFDCLFFPLGGDGQKVAVTHHGHHSGQHFGSGFIHRHQLRAIRRRAHHAAKYHGGQTHVLHIGGTAGDFGGEIATRHALADHFVLFGWFGFGFGCCGGFPFEIQVVG